MNTLFQANIFFFINSVFNILLIIFLLVIMYYTIPMLKDFKAIVKKARETSESTLNTINKVQDDLGGEARAVVRGVGRAVQMFYLKKKIQNSLHLTV